MNADVRAPLLFVKHSRGWNVDRCTLWMERAGVPVEFCYPVCGDAFPDPAGYAGVVVFGGRWSANDRHVEDWVLPEQRFIERCLATGVPYFGICLGAQMLAHVCGARVAPHADGAREVGFCQVLPTAAGQQFLSSPLQVMQWHKEGFELPAGATLLAGGDVFPNQAFGLSSQVVGVQFHPEVNPDVLAIWQARNRESKPDDLTELERSTHAADAVHHAAAIDAWLDGFLSAWPGSAACAA